MATWRQLEASEPELAGRIRAHIEGRVHKTIATLRADGAPRISGIETFFAGDDLWFGSMPNARKALDLRRDPRYALHSGSLDPPEWEGDAKLTGRAEEVTDGDRRRAVFESRGVPAPSGESHLFRLDIQEAVLIGLNAARDRLVVELWRPGREVSRMERE